jgi:hypothetical protein
VRAISFSKSHFPRDCCFTLSSMLTDREKSVLEFEGSWWLYPGPKDRAIRDYLTMSATRYYQILRRVLDHPEALQYAPLTVRRLRRVRDDSRERRVIERFQGGDHPSR